VIDKVGNVEEVYLTGELAEGIYSNDISLVIIGYPDLAYVQELAQKAQKVIQKNIAYTVYSPKEAPVLLLNAKHSLLLWHE